MKDGFYFIIIAWTVILGIFAVSKCESERQNRLTEQGVKIDTVRTTDTVRIVRIDTIYQKEIRYLQSVNKPKPDTVYLDKGATIHNYSGVQKDSLIDIHYSLKTTGILNNLVLGYKLLRPLQINKTTTQTVTNTDTITKEIYKGGFYLGGSFTSSKFNPLSFGINASYATVKGWQYGYIYNINLNSHTIGVQRRIF